MQKKYEIVILGGGESGIGAALLAKKKGFSVFVSELNVIKDNYKKLLVQNNIPFEEHHHNERVILSADTIIKSPGIPDNIFLIKVAQSEGIPVISEIEFAFRFTNAKIIAITGSNGKTTTSYLIYHLLKTANFDVALAGNMGESFAKVLAEKDHQYFVLEVSSFQLDGIDKFKPFISILLNITPDHLDRYDYEMQKYINSKFKILKNQNKEDFFIFNADDKNIIENIPQTPVNKIPFSIEKTLSKGAYYQNQTLIFKIKETMEMKTNEINLKGKHNYYNTLAAGIAGQILNIKKEHIRKAFSTFKGLEHRLEKYLTIRGITFINDSKATNVYSTWYALESMQTPVILIMGGIDKGNDYSILKPLVYEKVKSIIALGKDNSKIIKEFSEIVPVYDTKSMEEAVQLAYKLAQKGDTVLLSPACASFYLFENYIDRGNKFKEAVRNL